MGTSPLKPVVDLGVMTLGPVLWPYRFERDRKVFLSPDYKEEQLRASSGPSLSIRHSSFVIRTFLGVPVIHEESVKACPERSRRVAAASKSPDYTFRIGGRRVFSTIHASGLETLR